MRPPYHSIHHETLNGPSHTSFLGLSSLLSEPSSRVRVRVPSRWSMSHLGKSGVLRLRMDACLPVAHLEASCVHWPLYSYLPLNFATSIQSAVEELLRSLCLPMVFVLASFMAGCNFHETSALILSCVNILPTERERSFNTLGTCKGIDQELFGQTRKIHGIANSESLTEQVSFKGKVFVIACKTSMQMRVLTKRKVHAQPKTA